METVQFCKKCYETKTPPKCPGFLASWGNVKMAICPICNNNLITYNISADDIYVLSDISKDITFIEAMIKLKEDDIIEYESRMSQFRNQAAQQEQVQQAQKAAEESIIPHCPHCHSTNIAKIGTGERIGSIAVWGIFSKKINKSSKCRNCGYTW